MTVTVTNYHSNSDPKVLKIENENRKENKMKLKSIVFKPDIKCIKSILGDTNL